MNPKLNRAFDELSGKEADFNQPLVHQPGQQWEYGVSYNGFTPSYFVSLESDANTYASEGQHGLGGNCY